MSIADTIGRGLIKPLKRVHGDFEDGGGGDLLRSNVRTAISTDAATEDGAQLGEYPWRLALGSKIKLLRHANIRDPDEIEADLLIVYAAQAVATWEPRAFVVTDRSFVELPSSSAALTKEGLRTRKLVILFAAEDDVAGGVRQQEPFRLDSEVTL